jgi:hypothetical protein
VCSLIFYFLVISTDISAFWSICSNWPVDGLIRKNKCSPDHCTGLAGEKIVPVGTRHCSGSPLPIEWSEKVSTSSSIGGAGVILNLSSTGKIFITFVLAMKSYINFAHCWGFSRTYSI